MHQSTLSMVEPFEISKCESWPYSGRNATSKDICYPKEDIIYLLRSVGLSLEVGKEVDELIKCRKESNQRMKNWAYEIPYIGR